MSDSRHNVEVLRASHDRLAGLVGGLDGEQVVGPSYCRDWSVAQVCSHLGSGAELGLIFLGCAIAHTEPPGTEAFQPIWDAWNARSPSEQVSRCLEVDEAHVAAFEALDDAALAAAHISLFGVMEFDGGGLARFRLGEHALHTWDVAVALDPAARVAPDAVDLLVDGLTNFVSFLGKPQGGDWELVVRSTRPERTFRLASHESVTLAPVAAADADAEAATADGELRLGSEALLRLAYGRLDDTNGDGLALSSDSVTLDDLRATFPGI